MLLRYFLVLGGGWTMVGLMALFAHRAHMLTTAQMQAHGIPVGINFENHGSTWWLLAVLVSLAALLVGQCADQWPKEFTWAAWGWKILVAAAITVVMHIFWTLAPFPDFMVSRKWVPSLVAYPHMVIVCGYITILLMTYLETPRLEPNLAVFTAWYTTWHVFVGNHMINKASPPRGFPPYELWDPGPIGIICVVALIMTGATIRALR